VARRLAWVLALALLCAGGVALARTHKKPTKHPPARAKAKASSGCGASWNEAKQRHFEGCRALADLVRLFEADNRDGDTPFKAVAAVCYTRGGDGLMSRCLPQGDACPDGKPHQQCLESWFACCSR
jgi:hypothetical protein